MANSKATAPRAQIELFQSGAVGRLVTKPLHEPPTLEDLEPVQTLIPVFNAIRGFFAANATGMTRDEAILEELTKLLHAKVHDEQCGRSGAPLRFFALISDSPSIVRNRIADLYAESAVRQLNGGGERELLLDEQSCYYAVQSLHHRSLLGAERDVIGEAYETLIFPALRGGQGQFFTPKNVGTCLAALVNVKPGDRIIDPACGTGGFLSEVKARADAEFPGHHCELVGIDKDELLVRLTSDSLALRHIRSVVVCSNSLLPPTSQGSKAAALLESETYNVAITNPPFGSKIPVVGEEVLQQFDLGHKWTQAGDGRWFKQTALRDAVPPQILFIELCWRLLKEDGRCGIVLPEGILGNQSLGFVRQWLTERADVLAVVDCPLETFMPSTSTKTVLLVFQRRAIPKRPQVFMAMASSCGHDRRGNPLLTRSGEVNDDFPKIAELWQKRLAVAEADS